MSQEKLGDALNLTFQQIQKYERGTNRVGASRLYDLCRVFDVTADFFFEGLPNFEPAKDLGGGANAWFDAGSFAEKQTPFGQDEPPANRETAELVRAYGRITDPKVRERILELVKSLAMTPSSSGSSAGG
jgi:transcriptional regulator with XRE-family HTH domain